MIGINLEVSMKNSLKSISSLKIVRLKIMTIKFNSLLITFFLLSTLFALKMQAQSTIKLFNQKNLKGWCAYEPVFGKQKDATKIFYVDKKIIHLDGDKIGYLMSEKSFKNFQLTVEYKWNIDSTIIRKNSKKNSGIMYLVPATTPDTLWPKGIQFQIKEGATGDFVFLQNVILQVKGKQTEAGKSVVSPRFEDAEKPFGEWNTIVITSLNGNIKQELNGKVVNEGIQMEISEGRILLQYEGYPIDFRKVLVRKL